MTFEDFQGFSRFFKDFQGFWGDLNCSILDFDSSFLDKPCLEVQGF